MDEETYRIRIEWKDVLVYEEGAERSLRFDCGSTHQPIQVSVPDAARWDKQTPEWAHARRDLIVARLREAGHILVEEGEDYSAVISPDGEIRVETRTEWNDRGPDYRSVRIVGVATAVPEVAVNLPGADLSGVVEFPSPGTTIIPLSAGGQHRRVIVNVRAATFAFHPMHEEPLADLPARLAAMTWTPPAMPYQEPVPTSGRAVAGKVFMLVCCLLFVAAGLFLMASPREAGDRWKVALATLLFGTGAAVTAVELRGTLRARRRLPRKRVPER